MVVQNASNLIIGGIIGEWLIKEYWSQPGKYCGAETVLKE